MRKNKIAKRAGLGFRVQGFKDYISRVEGLGFKITRIRITKRVGLGFRVSRIRIKKRVGL